jgi:hypothetical protein
MSLLESVQLKIDPLHIEKINQIDNFDFSKTAKKVNHDLHGLTSDYLRDGIENLKKYYVVALLDPLNPHAVSRYVDPFWHAHILHTNEYMEFCESIFGQYIHHKPLDSDDLNEVKEITTLYSYTKEIYQKMFRNISSQWWPAVNQVDYGHAFGPMVCKHMLISNEAIRAKSLFPKKSILHLRAA